LLNIKHIPIEDYAYKKPPKCAYIVGKDFTFTRFFMQIIAKEISVKKKLRRQWADFDMKSVLLPPPPGSAASL
jgi:hypothetical protein